MGPGAAGSALARNAVAELSVVDASKPGTIRTGAAVGIATALAGPAEPKTVAFSGTVKLPTVRTTCVA